MIDAYLRHVEQEQEGTDALVTVGEGMVLDHEVEQIGRLFCAAAEKGFAEHGLLYIAEYRLQSIAAQVTEQGRGFTRRGQIALECGYRGENAIEGSRALVAGFTPAGVVRRSSSYSSRRRQVSAYAVMRCSTARPVSFTSAWLLSVRASNSKVCLASSRPRSVSLLSFSV